MNGWVITCYALQSLSLLKVSVESQKIDATKEKEEQLSPHQKETKTPPMEEEEIWIPAFANDLIDDEDDSPEEAEGDKRYIYEEWFHEFGNIEVDWDEEFEKK